ncbi:hypothetical protein ACFE04_024506 [Oxalis oulophora]
MDLDEWELLLPDDDDQGFIEKNPNHEILSSSKNTNNIFKLDHFKCPSTQTVVVTTNQQTTDMPSSSPVVVDDDDDDDQAMMRMMMITRVPSAENFENIKIASLSSLKADAAADDDKDSVFQPSSNLLDDKQFVDMKVETNNNNNNNNNNSNNSPKMVEDEDGLNLWKMSLNGIGAIFSFGVAAICIIALGSHQHKNNHNHHHFQLYTHDKQRIKQVVHQATKLNEVISAARGGVPLTNAHISFGGYYNGL